MEENRANCANMSFSERKVPKSIHCLLLHRGQEGRRLQTPCLLIPLPFLRDSWWGVGGEDRVLQAAHCSCAAGLAPTCPSASFPGQYFSTLESSIVSLFVLLTTAK